MLNSQGFQPQFLAREVEVLVIGVKPDILEDGRVGITLTGQGGLLPLHHAVPRADGHTQPPRSICKGDPSQARAAGHLTIFTSSPQVRHSHSTCRLQACDEVSPMEFLTMQL